MSRGCNPRSATVEALSSYYDDEYESYYDSEDEGMVFATPVQIEINDAGLPDSEPEEPVLELANVDWQQTQVYDLVLKLGSAQTKAEKKELEREFFNPQGQDVYTLEESNYWAGLLRQKHHLAKQKRDVVDPEELQAIHTKARRTLQLLSDHLAMNIVVK